MHPIWLEWKWYVYKQFCKYKYTLICKKYLWRIWISHPTKDIKFHNNQAISEQFDMWLLIRILLLEMSNFDNVSSLLT